MAYYPRLETERFLIRTVGPEDVDALLPIASDPLATRFLPEGPMDREALAETVDWIVEMYAKSVKERLVKLTLGIEDRASATLVGWCGLGIAEDFPDEVELFYTVAPALWGRGIATECGAAVMDYGFRVIGLDRLIATVDLRNLASIRVAEKLGMSRVREYGEGFVLYAARRPVP